MKKIILSLAIISLTVAGAVGATYAYFSQGKVLGATDSNTFSTGTVTLGDFNVTKLTVTGLVPGKWAPTISNIAVNYTGDVAADLYLGAGGTSAPGDLAYFADKLYVKVLATGTDTVLWEGWVKDLSTDWKKLKSNMSAGWQAFDLQFYLDPSMDKQGVVNTDTKILMYAVQADGPVPATVPYLTSF